jgi:hypothetical protein
MKLGKISLHDSSYIGFSGEKTFIWSFIKRCLRDLLSNKIQVAVNSYVHTNSMQYYGGLVSEHIRLKLCKEA